MSFRKLKQTLKAPSFRPGTNEHLSSTELDGALEDGQNTGNSYPQPVLGPHQEGESSRGSSTRTLCQKCSQIPFLQSEPRPPSSKQERYTGLSLEIVLQNHLTCKFCHVLYESLCQPRNDPFKHEAIRRDLQVGLKDETFASWAGKAADGSKIRLMKSAITEEKRWPFGHTLDKLPDEELLKQIIVLSNRKHNEQDSRNRNLQLGLVTTGAAAQFGLATAGAVVTEQRAGRIISGVSAGVAPVVYAASLQTILQKPTPLSCLLVLSPIDEFVKVEGTNHYRRYMGSIDVSVWAYGRTPRAPLQKLKRFILRVGTSKVEAEQGRDLVYAAKLQEKINFDAILQCLEHCKSNHPSSCESPTWSIRIDTESVPNFRVIDVNQYSLTYQNIADCEYACLSYVWGSKNKNNLQLSQSNEAMFLGAGTLCPDRTGKRIPSTIRAAIKIAKELRIRYLWVDSICIMQDTPDDANQIQMMDRIYGQAVLTIVAADSSDAGAGIPSVHERTCRAQVFTEIAPEVTVTLMDPPSLQLHPWDTRAWTLQEALLSRRLLIISGTEAQLHCNFSVAYEDVNCTGPEGEDSLAKRFTIPDDGYYALEVDTSDILGGRTRLLRSDFVRDYCQLITLYTVRLMGDSRDAINAVRGLLKVLERCRDAKLQPGEISPRMIYGIPEDILDLVLLWQPAAGEQVRLRRSDNRQFPSWSWAGWQGVPGVNCAGGVRFEEPFEAITDENGSLKKVISTNPEAEERMKPLNKWYQYLVEAKPIAAEDLYEPARSSGASRQSLAPVQSSSSCCSGPPVRKPEPRKPKPERLRARRILTPLSGLRFQGTPPDWVIPEARGMLEEDLTCFTAGSVTDRHLVFRAIIASFSLGDKAARPKIERYDETLWRRQKRIVESMLPPSAAKQDAVEQLETHVEHEVVEDHVINLARQPILDQHGKVVGWLTPADYLNPPRGNNRDFVALSEAQYFGDEARIDFARGHLLNVMLVEWEPVHTGQHTGNRHATRQALGRIYKYAWDAAEPRERIIALG